MKTIIMIKSTEKAVEQLTAFSNAKFYVKIYLTRCDSSV